MCTYIPTSVFEFAEVFQDLTPPSPSPFNGEGVFNPHR